MKMTHFAVLPATLCLSLSLFGCKQRAPATPAAAQPAAVSATAAAGAVPAAKAAAAAPAASFDFSTIAESSATLPPFPFVDYPPTVGEAFQSSQSAPFDEVYVILGKRYTPLQGRVAVRTFSNSDAKMSELEVRRNYEAALAALGAVKVNAIAPDDPALVVGNGDDSSARDDKMRIPEASLSYATYLIRKGNSRHWVVLMVNERTTRLIAVDEQAFVQSVGYEAGGGKTSPVTASGTPVAAAEPVDLAAIAASTAALPPFPYLAYPPTVGEAFQSTQKSNFDSVSVIFGKQLQALEGKIEIRTFYNSDAKMSTLDLRRNYEAAVKGLGGVKVNTVGPEDAALIAASGGDETLLRDKKLRLLERGMSYDSYLVRTPEKRAWVVLSFSDSKTRLMMVEEKAFAQSVPLVSADAMRDKLAAEGHVALYVNFDTDRATLRPDAKPTIAEITTLLKRDAALKLSIEGHTDNTGDAKRNVQLSAQRAQAVAASLQRSGIAPARLRTVGRGDSKPIAGNDDEAGRAKNRRVELVKVDAG